MIEWIVSSCVLIVLILIIRKLFRKKLEMRVLYALWLIVAVRLLVPFSFAESSISVQNLVKTDGMFENSSQVEGDENLNFFTDGEMPENLPNYQAGEVPVNGTVDESPDGGSWRDDSVHSDGSIFVENMVSGSHFNENIANSPSAGEEALPAGNSGLAETNSAERSNILGKAITSIWLLGVGVSILVLAGANFVYRRGVYATRIRTECEESTLPVYFSGKVNTPCMFGIIRPAIYLTEPAFGDEKALKYILCHENTHYRHRDNWWAIVRALCVCLHWYNPLVWLAAHVSKQDCELACDEETIKRLDAQEKIDYGRVLLAFSISGGNLYGRLQLATTMSGGNKQLKERLQMIVREPKRYVWAIVTVMLLVMPVLGVTFTGKAEENGENKELQSTEAGEDKGDDVANAEEDSGNAADNRKESETESTAEPITESVQSTMSGYAEYTGYMDECAAYQSYENFLNQDYDEDGLIDRVWRENIEDWAMCTYRIDFGNGDVLLMEKTGGGMPSVQTGDLDRDGQNEILFSIYYEYSTDPTAFGEWAVYKKNGTSYEMLKLPGELADYESDGNGGVLPAYQPTLTLAIEKADDLQAHIYYVGADGQSNFGEDFPKEAALDVTVSFGEEEWQIFDLDYYINQNQKHACSIYTAEIEEGSQPVLRMYGSMLGKWCVDEVVSTLVLKDGVLQMQDMDYMHQDTIHLNVDLDDGKTYQLEVGREYFVGNNTQKINWIYLIEIVDNTAEWICSVNLDEATAQEWGEADAVWVYEDYAFVIEDFNFDGYDDLAVQGWAGAKNIPYYCFLWNPVTKQYDYSALIPNVEVDKENQYVISTTNDGGGQYSTTYYKYDDKNQLHMVRYVEENLSPEAALPTLDLTYFADDYYALPAVDTYDREDGAYEGVRVSEMIYYAKKALEELYEYSGYRVEQAHFMVYESGNVVFGQTEEDMARGRHFYSRSYNELDGNFDIIPSMMLSTERDVWYSPVILWNVPENHSSMSDEELVRWFFEQAPITGGEAINYMEENFAENYVIETESGNWYEVTYNAEKRLIYSIYGPYSEYPTH